MGGQVQRSVGVWRPGQVGKLWAGLWADGWAVVRSVGRRV